MHPPSRTERPASAARPMDDAAPPLSERLQQIAVLAGRLLEGSAATIQVVTPQGTLREHAGTPVPAEVRDACLVRLRDADGFQAFVPDDGPHDADAGASAPVAFCAGRPLALPRADAQAVLAVFYDAARPLSAADRTAFASLAALAEDALAATLQAGSALHAAPAIGENVVNGLFRIEPGRGITYAN